MAEGGVHPPADSETTDRLLSEYERQMSEVKARTQMWQGHQKEYHQLKETLDTISDRVHHSATMIPVGKKAYMKGTLVRANEILVLLGDNWFAERTAQQANEICQRKIEMCTDMLEKLDKELTLVESWSRQASGLNAGNEVDIREPFDEQTEIKWAHEHRERVKAYKQLSHNQQQPNTPDDDEELFRRLDELEIEEELDEHLKKTEASQIAASAEQTNNIVDDRPKLVEKVPKLAEKVPEQAEKVPEVVKNVPELDDDNKTDGANKKTENKDPDVEKSGDKKSELATEEDEDNDPVLELLRQVVEEEKDSGRKSDDDSSEDWSESPPLSDVGQEVATSDAEIDAALEAAEETAKYNAVPDRSNFRRVSRFSVSEIMSERGVLDCTTELHSASRQEHLAKLPPRKRRVSFGGVSERLFMKDDEERPPAAEQQQQQPPETAQEEPPKEEEEKGEDVPIIYFSHDEDVTLPYRRPCQVPRVPENPSDFVRLYGSGSPTRLKSILRPSGSSHSLSSFEEESSSSSIGRFAVSPTKSSSLGRFSISPTKAEPSSPPTSWGATVGRFKVSPTKPFELDHPVGAVVVESAPRAQPPVQVPAQQQPVKVASGEEQPHEKHLEEQPSGQPSQQQKQPPQQQQQLEQQPTQEQHPEQPLAELATAKAEEQQPARKPSRFKLSRVHL